jgi:hypothetical protein
MEGKLEHVETCRHPASAFLLIDSQDRVQSSSSSDPSVAVQEKPESFLQPMNNFTIYKRQPFLTGYFHRIAVTECRFEFGTPNVNRRNNLIQFDVVDVSGGNFVTIEINEGFYTPDELASELETQLNTDISGATWTVNYIADCFEITCSDEFVISPYPYPTVEQTLRGLFYMMNFSAKNNGFVPANYSTTQIGMFHPPLVYTRYIDICSRTLTQYQKVKDNSTRENQTPAVLCRIYLTNDENPAYPGSAGTVIERIWNTPKYSSWSPGQFIDQIDIQLRDDAGNLLYIEYNGEQTEAGLKGAIENNNQFQLTLHCSES